MVRSVTTPIETMLIRYVILSNQVLSNNHKGVFKISEEINSYIVPTTVVIKVVIWIWISLNQSIILDIVLITLVNDSLTELTVLNGLLNRDADTVSAYAEENIGEINCVDSTAKGIKVSLEMCCL